MSLSTTATTAIPAVPRSLALRIPRRPLKLFAAGTLVFAGAYGILSEQQYVTTSNSVVSAYVLDVRTPIEGVVTQLPRTPGTAIVQNQLLAHIENPFADHQHLDNLRTLEDTAQSTADADAAELQALTAQQHALITRAGAHSEAVTARLSLTVAEAESMQSSREAQWRESAHELFRARQLHTAGILSNADYDKAQSSESIARRDLEAQHAALKSLLTQRASASHGLLSEPGTNNDVAYSRQRADELAIKLAETNRSLAASRAQALQAHAAVVTESARAASLRTVDLRSPATGQIFEVHAMDGEVAPLQTPILSLVDCSRQFLLAEVPQDRMPDIALGGPVRFKLAGESTERLGTVQSHHRRPPERNSTTSTPPSPLKTPPNPSPPSASPSPTPPPPASSAAPPASSSPPTPPTALPAPSANTSRSCITHLGAPGLDAQTWDF